MQNWSEYSSVFRLPEYQCQTLEVFDKNENGYVQYGFFDDDLMVARVVISFSMETETACVTAMFVHPEYQNQGIGRKIAYGLRDFAIKCGWINKKVVTTATQNEGSEPFATGIGPQINLNDLDSAYMIWREQYAQEMGFTD
jgi:GNAT superfamily N-acetyltransferase